jgi:multidrug transporter EmrE-like cation transporter
MFLNNWEIQLNYIPAALLIGVFSYGISIVLYVTSAQNLGATRSQILFSTAPFWGIFAAWVFLDEPLSLIVLVSFSILLLGIIFTNIASHGHAHYHKGMVHIHQHSHNDSHHNNNHEEDDYKSLKHLHLHEHKETEHTHIHYPDTRIKQHPVCFGSSTGEWTAVTGIMEGTFSKPMPIGNGKFIQPTGKSFKLPMCTIGHWVNGIMNVEYLFWDNQTYMNQLRLGK